MKLQTKASGLWWGNQRVTDQNLLNISPGEEFRKYLSLPTTSFSLAPFPGGDVAMGTASGTVGLERKRGDDLVSSWASGHLAEQFAVMLDSYDHVVAVVEDTDRLIEALAYYGERASDRLQDDWLTYQERGVRLYFSVSEADTARVVEHLFRRYNNTTHHALDYLGKQAGNVQRRQLLAVPGWGGETVTQALDAFGTPIAVVTAPMKKLERARISPRRVRYLFEAFGRTYARVHSKVAYGQAHKYGARPWRRGRDDGSGNGDGRGRP